MVVADARDSNNDFFDDGGVVKMYKDLSRGKQLMLALALALVMMLAGCNINISAPRESEPETEATETDATTEVVNELDDETMVDELETIDAVEESEDLYETTEFSEVAEDSTYGTPEGFLDYVVSDSAAGLANGVYLKRDGKFYNINRSIPDFHTDAPQYGFSWPIVANTTIVYSGDMYRDGECYCASMGDNIPVIELQGGDEIIKVDNQVVTPLMMSSVTFYGYGVALSMTPDSGGAFRCWNTYDGFLGDTYGSDVEVTDMNGNIVDDYYNLDPEAMYMVSWLEGTSLHEVSARADNAIYKYDTFDGGILDVDYSLPANVTRDGYATYDISTVEPGLYAILGGAVIRIP